MINYFEEFLLYSGEHYTIFFHAESRKSSEAYEYFENCDDATQASLLFLAKRMGDEGRIYDETKFRIEDKKNKIYCFKPRKERFFCFFIIGKKIIVTSAYTKQKQKLDKKELRNAVQIRNLYMKKLRRK